MTHETIMLLAHRYADTFYIRDTAEASMKARDALSTAIAEVLAERDQLKQAINEELPTLEALNKRFGEVVAERDALARAGYSLTAKLCAAGVVAEKDGYELIRRESVMDLIYAWKREKEMKGTPT